MKHGMLLIRGASADFPDIDTWVARIAIRVVLTRLDRILSRPFASLIRRHCLWRVAQCSLV